MELSLKFTGTFSKLKALGCTFHKLYAWNYKVYSYQISPGNRFWIWVHHGGYFELNDFYSNTKAIVEKLKLIEWSSIQSRTGFSGEEYKRIILRFSHNHPDRGCEISELSRMELQQKKFDELLEDKSERSKEERSEIFKKALESIDEHFDREFVVFEETAKEIIRVYEMLQNS